MTVIGIARRSDALWALVSCATSEEQDLRCAIEEKRIGDHGGMGHPRGALVCEAWRILSWGRADDPSVIAAATVLLLETVPGERSGGPSVFRRRSEEISRGRGKHSLGDPRDLRSALLDAQAWNALRARLGSEEVVAELHARGYSRTRMEDLRHARDPYAAYHHGSPTARVADLPERFRLTLLPALQGRPWNEILEALELYWTLGLASDGPLLATLSYLASRSPAHGVRWARVVFLGVPPERRSLVLRELVAESAFEVDPSEWAPLLQDLSAPGEKTYRLRLGFVLGSARARVPADQIADLLRIADAYDPWHRFYAPPRITSLSARRRALTLLRPLFERVAALETPPYPSPVDVFGEGASNPAVAGILSRGRFGDWPPVTARTVLRLSTRCWHSRCIEARLSILDNLLRDVPPERQGRVLEVYSALRDRTGRPEARVRLMKVAAALTLRMPRPADGEDVASPVRLLADLAEAAGQRAAPRLLGAPAASFERLLRNLSTGTRADVLHWGLEAMARSAPTLVVEAFVAHPEALFQTARLLGGLSEPRQGQLLRSFRRHPLMDRGLLNRSVAKIVDTVSSYGLPSPVPRRLREHLAGRITLAPTGIERHRQSLTRKMLPLRLSLLRRMVLDDLRIGLPDVDVEDRNERHALQMLGSLGRNRRLLRRVLGMPADRREEFLTTHPANRAWLRRHPCVDCRLWSHGLDRTAPGSPPLRLTFEIRPLEALRLGTEVGSCLSVRGGNQDWAVAVMADANKQVIFARSPKGVFVARQIVAVAEDDRLVFFPVYPRSSPGPVAEAFLDYDLALSAALGLGSHHSETYRIANIVTGFDYDDGLWEPFYDDSSAPRP